MDLASIARALPNGRVISGGVSFAAPGHSHLDDSGRVLLRPGMPYDLFVCSLAGEDGLGLRDYVLETLDRQGVIRLDREKPRGSKAPARPSREPAPSRSPDHSEVERRVRALEIFREAGPFWGSPAEAYLVRERRLDLFDGLERSLRFHPDCPFGAHRTPAMVALVRDVRTNEPRAIHRTALTLDGRKVVVGDQDRLTLAPISGGAIKLTPDEDVTLCLGVGEGIESALSLRLLPEFGASPVWSMISSNGIKGLPVLAGIEAVWIAVDHDPAGLGASQGCAERWQAAGVDSFLITPHAERSDLNDVFNGRYHG